MKYDFTTVYKRYGCGSGKWDEMQRENPNVGEDVIPFSVADMEFVEAPEIVEGLKAFLDTTVLGYANATDSYKEAVCAWMKKRHNWDAKPEWILPSHGVVDAFFSAIKCYTNEGDGVMLLTPVYYPMYIGIKVNNRVLVDCPLVERGDTYEIDFEDFEKKAKDPNTKLFILCSPHNPCGRVWTKEELERIGRICNENHVLVVDDEIHHDLIMPGHTHYVYASLSKEMEQNCLVLTAPSKTFNLAGLQTSNIFVPNEALRREMEAFLKRGSANPKCNILGYKACEIAYSSCGEWLDECIQVIDENRRVITEFMAENFPQIRVCELQATYLLWMDWNGLGLDYKELERINRQEAGLFFDEGYIFGAQGEGFERWNLACPTSYVVAALKRMKEAYGKYVK
ncbi:MalY/PatB family protein [Enterocloster asparagiformis]|uniref:MalY/PatB family protein n=1 Tax=Enterocloster asparagiformis TaxID=333367 RepID=UPI00046605DA|nr:MalY/PatB family protein [Enterocloster asparagiformis]